MRSVRFLQESLAELSDYKFSQPNLVFNVFELLLDIEKTPFEGLGKPEPLKGSLQGYWSRRITDEHRLIYKATNKEVIVFSRKSHYRQFE